MIISWSDKESQQIYEGDYSKKLPEDIQKKARQKLIMIDSAVRINDLMAPLGNRLHKLTGNRKGQYSISINDQWRICFKWNDGNVNNVEIVDYHD